MHVGEPRAPVLPGQFARGKFLVRRNSGGGFFGTVIEQAAEGGLAIGHLAAFESARELSGVADLTGGNVDQLDGQCHRRRFGKR